MSKRTYEELRDMLRHELDVLTKKGEITKESLDHFQKLTSSLWKIEELMKAEEESSNGYSQRGNYSNRYMMPMDSYGSYEGQSMRQSMMGQSQNGQSMNYAGNSNNYGGGSNDYSRNRGGSNDGSYDGSYEGSYNRGSYNEGSSYARRGRDGDGDGRYSEAGDNYSRRRGSYGRYSRHTEKEKMIEKLERMADSASEKERRAIMECIDELEGQ